MLAEDLGFHGGLPIAALLIFRAALHWRSFQTDSATFFDRVIDTIRLQVPQTTLYMTLADEPCVCSQSSAAATLQP